MKNILKNTVLVMLLLVCIAIFVLAIAHRNKTEIWFRNYDQDTHLVIETIRVNAGNAPKFLIHPSHGTYIIYSLGLRFCERTGLIPASSFAQLKDSDDPLMLLPEIFYKARWISIFLCVLCSLVFGAIFLVLFRSFVLAVIAAVFLLFTNGIILQALLIRSELPSGLFILLSILFLSIEYKTNRKHFGSICLITSGFCLGLSVLSKIHAIPAIFFLMIYLGISIFKKKQSQRNNYSRHVMFYSIASLVFCVFSGIQILKIHKIDGSDVPALLVVFLVSTIIFSLAGLFARIQKFSATLFCFKSALLFIGFLASFYLSFSQLNFYKYPSKISCNYQVQTYERVFQPISSSSKYYISAKDGNFLAQFTCFYNHYTASKLDYIAIILIVAVLLLDSRFNLLRCLAMLTFSFGIIFCLVSSLRWFGAYYLIYSDMFIVGGLILLAVEYNKEYRLKFPSKTRQKTLYVFNLILCLIILLSGVKQYNRTMRLYQNWCPWNQNRVDRVHDLGEVPFYSEENRPYRELMLSKYGSIENIRRKVCNDPHLNGTDRGINLREKKNVEKYMNYFEE